MDIAGQGLDASHATTVAAVQAQGLLLAAPHVRRPLGAMPEWWGFYHSAGIIVGAPVVAGVVAHARGHSGLLYGAGTFLAAYYLLRAFNAVPSA